MYVPDKVGPSLTTLSHLEAHLEAASKPVVYVPAVSVDSPHPHPANPHRPWGKHTIPTRPLPLQRPPPTIVFINIVRQQLVYDFSVKGDLVLLAEIREGGWPRLECS